MRRVDSSVAGEECTGTVRDVSLPHQANPLGDARRVSEIVLTGGPCAGKTTALEVLSQKLSDYGYQVLVCPETASLVINAGVAVGQLAQDPATWLEFQRLVVRTQGALRERFRAIASLYDEPVVILFDRAEMDNAAYIDPDLFAALLEDEGTPVARVRDSYDAVIHLVSAADGAEHAYTTENNAARVTRYVTSGAASEITLIAMMMNRALPAKAKAWMVDQLRDPHLAVTLLTTQTLSATQVEALIGRVGDALTGDQWRTLWSVRRDLGLGSSPLLARVYPHLGTRDRLEAIAISTRAGLIGRDESDEVARLVMAWLGEWTPRAATYVAQLHHQLPFLRTLAYFIEHRPELMDALRVVREHDAGELDWDRRRRAVVASVVTSRHWTGSDTQRAWLGGAAPLPDEIVLAVMANPVTHPETIEALARYLAGRRSATLSGALERVTRWRSRWPAEFDYATVDVASAGAILDYLALETSIDTTSIRTPWHLARVHGLDALGTNEALLVGAVAVADHLAAQSRTLRRRISREIRLVGWSRQGVDPTGAGDETAQRRVPRRHELATSTSIDCPARGRNRPRGFFHRNEIDAFAAGLGDSIEAHRVAHSLLPVWTGSLDELADVAREMGGTAETTAA